MSSDPEFREKFFGLMKETLKNPEPCCQLCPFFAQGRVIEFLMETMTEALKRIDISAQVMEDYIKLFRELEEELFKEKMRGGSDL